MAKPQTKIGVFEGELYFARVFEANMDNSDFHEATQGEYNLMFVPKDDETLEQMKAYGFPETSMGNQMIKPIDKAGGRLGMKLKRPNVHKSGISDFGGAPAVTKGKTNVPWSYEKDGALGNGTTAAVVVSFYGEGSRASIRLEKVGVLEHVPYEENAPQVVGW